MNIYCSIKEKANSHQYNLGISELALFDIVDLYNVQAMDHFVVEKTASYWWSTFAWKGLPLGPLLLQAFILMAYGCLGRHHTRAARCAM